MGNTFSESMKGGWGESGGNCNLVTNDLPDWMEFAGAGPRSSEADGVSCRCCSCDLPPNNFRYIEYGRLGPNRVFLFYVQHPEPITLTYTLSASGPGFSAGTTITTTKELSYVKKK